MTRRCAVVFNTFSVAAHCPCTGMFGVAVATAALAVGGFVPFARSGVGAVATQCCTNPYAGIRGLELLEDGMSADSALARVLQHDEGREWRQISIVDVSGQSAAFTGSQAPSWAGHLTGDGYAVAGNTLVGETTVRAMAHAFEESEGEMLPERLLCSLEAGQAAGGDRRGKQSSALYVVHTEAYGLVDLRVDDHADPIGELRRLWELHRRTLLPFMAMFPTRSRPAGVLDPREWQRVEREIAETREVAVVIQPPQTGEIP